MDPDNRRPIDFIHRNTMLGTLLTLAGKTVQQRIVGVRALCDSLEDGQAKLFVINSALALRKRCPQIFLQGNYVPLIVKGDQAAHVCAYARIAGKCIIITVAPRFFSELVGKTEMLPIGEKIWGNTTVSLPFNRLGTHYICAFTGKLIKPQQHLTTWRLPVALLLTELPVGLIVNEFV